MNYLKHWTQPDHITFLLIAPAILLDFKSIAMILWIVAFVYDLYEGYAGIE